LSSISQGSENLEFVSMQVTLVVKTPHVKLPDLIFSSEVTSDVFQLKTYLQDQYSSKPKPSEQRLIYSGKLLLDHEVLKDFLRNLDTELTHTIHLVYAITRLSSDIVDQTNNMANVELPVAEDGLRFRTNTISPSVGDQWVNNRQPFAVFGHQPTDAVTAQQMLWWQQTYAQNYWAQYMHYLSTTNALGATSIPVASAGPSAPIVAGVEDRQQQPEAAPRRPPLVVGGVEQEEDDDGGIRAARDWLDWFYIGSRFAILLGVMYFYSSLPRFMLVTFIVAGIYLYQKAVHQRRVGGAGTNDEVNNNNNNNNNGNGQADADRPEESEETESRATETRQQPSGLNVAINLFVGFFTSLIPEVPAPEAI